jgi:RNA polymerase sigma-70 factor, ECF subfamily
VADPRRTRFEREALVYLDELFRVARRVTGDTAVAEDMVQDTCLRAWEAFDRYEPGTNCRAWLYKILFRTIAGRRRELQREMTMFDAQPFEESRSVITPAYSALDAHQLQRAFAELPVAFAAVIQLIDVEGLTYKEAADALDVPVGTVMSRLHRARRQLRDRLAPGPSLVKRLGERS